jgi:hypothetical protein
MPKPIRPRCFSVLGEEFRLRILEFLGPDDLAEAAVVSRQFRDDCRHESLPQERPAVIRIPPDCPIRDRLQRIVTCLIKMAKATLPDGRRKFQKFSRLRVVDTHQPFNDLDDLFYNRWWPSDFRIPEIKSLDLSGEDPGCGRWRRTRKTTEYSLLARRSTGQGRILAVAGGVGRARRQSNLVSLPNVVEVDFSHSRTACILTLHDLRSDRLEKVTWHGHSCRLPLPGDYLINCPKLRELYMDGACFDAKRGDLLLVSLQDRLARVSIMDAHYYAEFRRDPKPIPQSMLIRFVRNAPNLRWFRSDLTSENVAMLQRERPDVVFALGRGESGFPSRERLSDSDSDSFSSLRVR